VIPLLLLSAEPSDLYCKGFTIVNYDCKVHFNLKHALLS